MSLEPGSRLGRYELEAPLGAGGMDEVYKARDPRLDRTVAIKILPAHLAASAEARERLTCEAEAVSSLQGRRWTSCWRCPCLEGIVAPAVFDVPHDLVHDSGLGEEGDDLHLSAAAKAEQRPGSSNTTPVPTFREEPLVQRLQERLIESDQRERDASGNGPAPHVLSQERQQTRRALAAALRKRDDTDHADLRFRHPRSARRPWRDSRHG